MPIGKSGIELQYENDLKGIPGKTLIFKMNNKSSFGTFEKHKMEKMSS